MNLSSPNSRRKLLSWYAKRQLLYKLVVAITIVALLISPIGLDRPRPASAEPMTASAVATVLAGACGIGMVGSMITWYFEHGGILETASNNPDFLKSLGIGCFTGMITIWIPIPGVRPWLSEILKIPIDFAIGYAAEKAYFKWGEPVIQVLIDNWYTLLKIATNPSLFFAVALLSEESEQSQDLFQLMYDLVTLFQATTGEELTLEIVPVDALDINEPVGGVLYQLDPVSADIIDPEGISICTDPDTGTISDVKYVQFGYAFSPSPDSVYTLPSPNAIDGKDWYGCNGWGLDFDIQQTDITAYTQIYIAARAEDISGNLTEWEFSNQLFAYPKAEHDLSVTNIQFTPTSPDVGDSVQVSATVTNMGANDESNVRLDLYVDGVDRGDHWISLPEGGTGTATFTWIAQQGAHTLRVEHRLATDDDPSNNTASTNVIVGTAPLVWVNGSGSPTAMQISATTQGTTGSFSATVQNVGSAPTTVTVSKGGAYSSWIGLSTSSFGLNPSSSADYSFSVDVPSGQSTGTYNAELRFDWTGGPQVKLPIQIEVNDYLTGEFRWDFSLSSAVINGNFQSTLVKGHPTVTLDNYASTSNDRELNKSFTLSKGEYDRIRGDTSDEWIVDVREIESQSSSTGPYFRLGGNLIQSVTNSFSGSFDIYKYLIIGQNNWRIKLGYSDPDGNNTEWRIDETKFILTLTQSAWSDDGLRPGDSEVSTWRGGWDYGRVCGNVTNVSRDGDVDLYNNGINVSTKYISSGDVGGEVCWGLSASEVDASNYFNLKARLGGAIVSLNNLYFEVHYFTGEPSLQVERELSTDRANIDQNITATMYFTNIGSNIADNPRYNETLPSGLQLVSGSLSGRTPDVDPGETRTETYTFKGTVPGAYTIPGSSVTYRNRSQTNNYETTFNTSNIEIWGGTLQPVLDALVCGEVGDAVPLQGTVTETVNGTDILDAQVTAVITAPSSVTTEVSIQWDGSLTKYTGSYVPSEVGTHEFQLSASKPYHTQGSSLILECSVEAKNTPPSAHAAANPNSGPAPLEVTLDGSGTTDVDGVIELYEWDVDGDGQTDATGRTVSWTFTNEGQHDITLTVVDNDGGKDIDTVQVVVVSGYIIEGYLRTSDGQGISNVVLAGLPGSPVTDGDGQYVGVVPSGWTGTVTPSKDRYQFSPPSLTYSNVIANRSGQDYTGFPECFTLTLSHTNLGEDPTASPTSSSGCSPDHYIAGEVIQLTAGLAIGWEVGSWSGTDDDASTLSNNTITMPAGPHTVTVNYVESRSVTTTIVAIKDVYAVDGIGWGDPNQNYNDQTRMGAGTESNTTMKSVMQFDLSSIPSNATILNAYIQLRVKQRTSSEPVPVVNAYQATTTWGESTLTWNNFPNFNSSPIVDVPINSMTTIIEITALAQTWLDNPSQNLGIMLQRTSGSGHVLWFSREYTVADWLPRLIVEYEEPSLCETVTEIPAPECEALVILYSSTDGDNWSNNTGWLTTNTPCSWNGVACNIGYVTNINLDNNQLSGIIPAEIGGLNSLTSLALENNQLSGSIPAELGSLSGLNNLSLQNNQLIGNIPAQIANLTSLSIANFDYNRLSAVDSGIIAFLNSKNPDWADTQTVAPANVQVVDGTASSIFLSWTPIIYTGDGGYYQVSYATAPGGPYTVHGTTADKTAAGYNVDGLNPGTSYYFVVETFTPSHGWQQNELWSNYSQEISAATLYMVYLPLVLK